MITGIRPVAGVHRAAVSRAGARPGGSSSADHRASGSGNAGGAALIASPPEAGHSIPEVCGSWPLVSARWCRPAGVGPLVSARWCRPAGVGPLVSARWCRPAGVGPLVSARWCRPRNRGDTSESDRVRSRSHVWRSDSLTTSSIPSLAISIPSRRIDYAANDYHCTRIDAPDLGLPGQNYARPSSFAFSASPSLTLRGSTGNLRRVPRRVAPNR